MQAVFTKNEQTADLIISLAFISGKSVTTHSLLIDHLIGKAYQHNYLIGSTLLSPDRQVSCCSLMMNTSCRQDKEDTNIYISWDYRLIYQTLLSYCASLDYHACTLGRQVSFCRLIINTSFWQGQYQYWYLDFKRLSVDLIYKSIVTIILCTHRWHASTIGRQVSCCKLIINASYWQGKADTNNNI